MSRLEDCIHSLKCEKVTPENSSAIMQLLDAFDFGEQGKKGSNVSFNMLERLKKYISKSSKEPEIYDMYYVIHDDHDIFLFFSLQASLIFSTRQITPDALPLLKCAFHSAMDTVDESYQDIPENDSFRGAMEMYDLKEYCEMSDEQLDFLKYKVSKIVSSKKSDKQSNVYVERTIPSIELVNFCKNHKAEEKWKENGFTISLVPTLFWYIILPIIQKVSMEIGCVYVSLFAADVSEENSDGKRNLLSYYENAYAFVENKNLSAIKPFYDWECVFLCQKISVLIEKADGFKKNYLSELSEDDV